MWTIESTFLWVNLFVFGPRSQHGNIWSLSCSHFHYLIAKIIDLKKRGGSTSFIMSLKIKSFPNAKIDVFDWYTLKINWLNAKVEIFMATLNTDLCKY